MGWKKIILIILILGILCAGIFFVLKHSYLNKAREGAGVSNPVNLNSIDCGKDIDCFIEASKTCSPAIWTNEYGLGYQITGLKEENCNVYIEFINGDCPYERNELTSMLERWKQGDWKNSDLSVCNQTSQVTIE